MQFVGNGKDPRFPKGQPFDIPDGDTVTIEKILADGVADKQDLVGQVGEDDPAKRVVEVADADLRGDPLAHAQDAALADSLTDKQERKVDESHDPSAVSGSVAGKAEKAAGEHSPDEGHADAKPGAARRGARK